MDRLLTLDKQEYLRRMQADVQRVLAQVADAVNAAPTGNVISGSEVAVRDAMAELRRTAFETAVQMRIDSTESSFSPAAGRVIGPSEAEQGAIEPQHGQPQRADQPEPDPLAQRRRGGRWRQ